VSASEPAAYLSIKLCDVFPDGNSALVSRGALQTWGAGAQRGTASIRMLPGAVEEVVVELERLCLRVRAGAHRLRISVAERTGRTRLRPPSPLSLIVHGGELGAPGVAWTVNLRRAGPSSPGRQARRSPPGWTWRVERDVLAGTTTCVVAHGSTYDTPHDGEATEHYEGEGQHRPGDLRAAHARP
jgi:hypothetical protein